jgi:regulatory protein
VDLARRLKDKGFAPATIEGVLGRLADVGLVDDAEYARAWLAGRRGRRPSGWRRLESELRAKGVAADDIARARAMLEEREGAVDEVAAARKAVAAAELRMAALDPRVRRGRLWGLLARRGFTPDVIREALGIPEATAPDPVE